MNISNGVAMIIWVGIFLNLLLILALVYFIYDIFRLFTNAKFRQCPPYVPSFGRQKDIIIERTSALLAGSSKQMQVLDPGCGTGTLLIKLAKKFPEHRFVGIEWRKTTAAIARLRTRKIKNIEIIQDDMFNQSFSDFNIIICFLMQPLMARFGEKLKQDCKPGTIVFSNSFYIPDEEPAEKIETDGVYKFKDVYVYRY